MPVPKRYRVGGWEVGDPIASGAFGSVYRARRTGPSPGEGEPERAALKFLPTGTHTPRQLRHLAELAEREVELLSRLHSPRLIRMYETLTVDDVERPELDGATVLVLEEATGSLDALLAKSPRPATGPVLLAQICEGLEQLHRAGWVHGDLKPANVLLMADGSARLADFNMAAEMEGTHAYSPAFATPDYTPPELLWSEIGERGMQIRPTADIWAFGVLAHLVLTGSHPLPGATPTTRRHAAVQFALGTEELRLSPQLPEEWREIITDCLSPNHAERATHDTESLLRRVDSAAGTTPSPQLRSARPLLHNRWLWATAAALVAGVTSLTLTLGGDPEGSGGKDPAGTRPVGIDATKTGYDRCAAGNVCFFTEADGEGEICAWNGDDIDWADGEISCSWAHTKKSRSVFNNGAGAGTGEEYIDVVYYAKAYLRERLACVGNGAKRNLRKPNQPLSHSWVYMC